MAGHLFCLCLSVEKRGDTRMLRWQRRALPRRLKTRENSTDTSFDGREGRKRQGFLPLLGDLNSLALSSVPACRPGRHSSDCEMTSLRNCSLGHCGADAGG